MAVWESPDVRFRNTLFGNGKAGRWKGPELRNTLPPPDINYQFTLNWADVMFDAMDFTDPYSVTIENPDTL